MRAVAIIAAMSAGCSVYFGHDHHGTDATAWTDAPTPDAPFTGPFNVATVVATRPSTLFGITGRLGQMGPDTIFDGYGAAGCDRATGALSRVLSALPGYYTGDLGVAVVLDGTTAIVQNMTSNHHITLNYPSIFVCPDDTCPPMPVITDTQPANGLWYLLAASGGQLYAYEWQSGDLVTCPETSCTTLATVTSVPATYPAFYPPEKVFGFADAAGLVILDVPTLFVLPSGGSLASIATVNDTIYGFFADASSIFWATRTAIASCPRSSDPCTPATFTIGTAIRGLHVDATRVYWVDGDTVYRCPRTGCTTPEAIATCAHTSYLDDDPVERAHQLYGDDQYLYCSEGITVDYPASPVDVIEIAK